MTEEQEQRCQKALEESLYHPMNAHGAFGAGFHVGYAKAIEREVDYKGNLWSTLFVNALRLSQEDQEKLVTRLQPQLQQAINLKKVMEHHDRVSELIEDPAAGDEEIRKAVAELCCALNECYEEEHA